MNQSTQRQSVAALRTALNHFIDLELALTRRDSAASKGMSNLARAVSAEAGREVSRQWIWNWLHRDKLVPAEMCIPIEKATGGTVTRYELRPDVYGEPQ
jgi:malate synthase